MKGVICCNKANSKETSMTKTIDTQSPSVFGVILVDERSASNKLLLGSIILSKNDMCSSCINLRQMINKELQSIIPIRYNFVSKEGWPLTDEQELKLKINHIIDEENKTVSIRKTFDKPRIGIVNTNGDCIGYVNLEASSKLFEIRQAITSLLNEVVQHNQVDYFFIDKQGWPVLSSQENSLSLIDLVKNHCICIKPKIVSSDLPYPSCNYSNSISLEDNKVNRYSKQRELASPKESKEIESEFKRRSKTLINRTNTFVWRKKDKQKKTSRKHIIMISYVRNEASLHAIKLKRSLVNLGFSVFLDVHEIETGVDWQDALNDAVTACEVFIPLITPMYGKTIWTNREVKLADMLNKLIIPVNFLEKYPPSCLSIQFATIQFIHWKPTMPQESEHVDSPQPQQSDSQNDKSWLDNWPDHHIQQVSILIAKQTPFEEDMQRQHKQSFLECKSPVLLSPSANLAPEDSTTNKVLVKNKKINNNQIVISAHPQQKKLADDLRSNLQKENYDVWVSTDFLDLNPKSPTLNGYMSIDYPETPDSMVSLNEIQSLSTISEITEQNSARATSSSNESNEKKSSNKLPNGDLHQDILPLTPTISSITTIQQQKDIIKRPTSLPIAKIDNNFFFNYEKRALKRLPSQISEISQSISNTLTPEKMERLAQFQDKVANSKLVIIMISDAYFKSKTSKNHVYYCEHRKKMLLIKTDQTTLPTPSWFSNLIPDENMLQLQLSNPKFNQVLKTRIKRKIDSKQLINPDNTVEQKLQYYTKIMKKKLPEAAECCVYFLGSSKPVSNKSVEICKAIGVELAKIRNIVIVTCGYGIADLVARSFYDKKLKRNSITEEPNVVHILPHKESKDFSHICKQTKEKSFEELDYGKTLFLGESMKERDKVVARLLNTCILIEGDLDTVYQAEEFIWNDHFVIPVPASGGAASGTEFGGLPIKCFDIPTGVEESDWLRLSNQKSSPEEIAKSICRIIINLKKSILNQYILTLEESSCDKFKKSIRKKRIDDKLEVLNKQLTEDQSDSLSENSSPEKVLPVVESLKPNDANLKSKWSKMQKFIWLSRKK